MQDLENKICWWENHATSLFWKFAWKSVSWWKIPRKLFWFKKFQENQFRWFQNDQIEFVNEVSRSLLYLKRLHENCLHHWWNKNQYHITDGIDRWTDFKRMQCKETGFFERKSTNFIDRQPSEVFVNNQKALKIDSIWKEPNSQSYLEKRSWKNLCWYVLLITSFRWRLLYENRWSVHKKKRVNWLEARKNQFFLMAIPSRRQFSE